LSPAMLMDLAAYSAWEQHMVRRCAADVLPEAALATLFSDAARVSTWRPGGISLSCAIEQLPSQVMGAEPHVTLSQSFVRRNEVVASIPDDLKPQPDDGGLATAYADYVKPEWSTLQRPVNRYLATKAFASWTAYQGKGLMTIVRGLEAALALVRTESSRQCRDARRPLDRDLLLQAFRAADFALNHLAAGEELAAAWSRAERRDRL
jgi:hypothetical protein